MTYYFKDLQITNLFYNASAKKKKKNLIRQCLSAWRDLANMAVKDARGCASKVAPMLIVSKFLDKKSIACEKMIFTPNTTLHG
jgi:hypothetical protein